MTTLAELSSDFSHLYLNEKLYVPKIADRMRKEEGFNESVVYLKAHLSDDLNWTEEQKKAFELASQGIHIVWEIDLGLDQKPLFTSDAASFLSHTQALEYFSKEVLPHFSAHTRGLILYRGDSHFEDKILWTDKEQEFYEEWLKDKKLEGTAHNKSVFCANAFSEYLHRLIAFLPDSLIVYALFSVQGENTAKMVHLLSKERFEHLFLGIDGLPFIFSSLAWNRGVSTLGYIGKDRQFTLSSPPPVAVVLPLDEYIKEQQLSRLEQIIKELLAERIPFKVVSEHFLTESWDEVLGIVVLPEAISHMGRRKLLGFVAAGGKVFYDKEPLPFLDEEAQKPFAAKNLVSDLEEANEV